MDYEALFSIAGVLAISGWLALLISPLIPKWSAQYAGLLIPILLSALYLVLALVPNANGGGFGSLKDVEQLFSQSAPLLAGWVHFLAFDLLIGAWICKTGRAEGIRFWFVAPTLLVTFLYGPAGFLLFSGVRFARARFQ